MSRNSYRSFLYLLQKWPVDESKKGGRDLGEYLRVRITSAFKQGDATVVDEAECQRIHSSLDRLASNLYSTKYPRTRKSSSTGLSVQQCHEINSTEFLKAMKEEDASFTSKMFKKN